MTMDYGLENLLFHATTPARSALSRRTRAVAELDLPVYELAVAVSTESCQVEPPFSQAKCFGGMINCLQRRTQIDSFL